MSATLTPKRKSARDRPASSKLRERGGDWGRESGRLTEELEVERRGVTLAVKTNAREKARAATNLVKQSRNLLVSRHSLRLALACRPPPVVLQPPSAHFSPRRRRPASLCCSLSLSLSLQLLSLLHKHLRCCITGTCCQAPV